MGSAPLARSSDRLTRIKLFFIGFLLFNAEA